MSDLKQVLSTSCHIKRSLKKNRKRKKEVFTHVKRSGKATRKKNGCKEL